jgi:RimJ/RimL family protein N-acetyltransferase
VQIELERIRTARLVLEPLSVEDARAIVAGDLSSVRPAPGWPHDDTLDGIRIALAHGVSTTWLVLLDGVVIGDCGLHGPPDEAGDLEIGYGLAEPSRGRGYGTELASALSDWVLAQPGVRRVVARDVLADNAASRVVLERAGFVLETDFGSTVSYARPRVP